MANGCYGPYRIVGVDVQPRVPTPIRDRTLRRRAELRAERLALSQDERGEALKEHLTDYLEAQADEKRRRQADAARVIRAHYREKEQAGADALVREIRRGVENLLELDGWSPEDIKTLLDSTPPRQYPTGDMYMVPVDDGPRLSDVYSWKIGRDGRYHLDLYPGQVQPLPDPDVPESPKYTEIVLPLGSLYGSWKQPKGDLSLNRYDAETRIPGGMTQEEEE